MKKHLAIPGAVVLLVAALALGAAGAGGGDAAHGQPTAGGRLEP